MSHLPPKLLPVLAALAAMACGGARTVQEGWLQKRLHRPGIHFDPHGGDRRRAAAVKPERAEVRAERLAVAVLSLPRYPATALPAPAMAGRAIAAQQAAAITPAEAPLPSSVPGMAWADDARPKLEVPATGDGQQNLMPKKKLHALAIPSLLLVLGGITLALTTTSTWAVIAALAAGLVLAGVSLRRIRLYERSGKGFALVALVLGVLASIITAMVVIDSGF